MTLRCPHCGEFVPAEKVNIQETLALCDSCGHVFDFRENVLMQKKKNRKVKQPDRLHIDEGDGWVRMMYRGVLAPDDRKTVAASVFLIFFMVLCFILAVTDYASPTVMAIIEAPPVAVFLYCVAMLLGNTTEVALDKKRLTVTYGPLRRLPFPPTTETESKMLDRDQVVRVFC